MARIAPGVAARRRPPILPPMARTTIPIEVSELLDDLLFAVQTELDQAFVGLYVRGSLVLGDFDPETSDVDFLVVTEERLDDAQFAALHAMHRRLEGSRSLYARRYEVAYRDRLALRRFVPHERHATLGQGESPEWSEHGANWTVERWTVREHGLRVVGPDPRTLIDPITSEALAAANRERLTDWARWLDHPEDRDWEAVRRGQMAYHVETMCRCRYAIETGTSATKPQAARWALEAFPEPWRTTVRRSRIWRADSTVDPKIVPEVRRLVRWATSEG